MIDEHSSDTVQARRRRVGFHTVLSFDSVTCSVPQGSSAGPVEFIANTEDVFEVFNRHGVQHHLYADNKQAYVDTPVSDIPPAHATLQSCITDVGDCCASRRLQLSETKTELIWFGSKKILGKVPGSELNLTVGSNIIQPVKSVRDLGVQLDTELSLRHVSKVASLLFLPVASFASDYTSRRSGTRSPVGFRVHTFPAGLL